MPFFSFVPIVSFIMLHLARFAFHGWPFPASASFCPWSFFQFLIIFSYNSYCTKTNPNPHSTNEQSPSKCFNITGPFISSSALVRFVFYRLLELFSVVAFILYAARFFYRHGIYIVSVCLFYIVHWLLQLVQRAPRFSPHYSLYMRTLNANLCMCKLFSRQKHSTHTQSHSLAHKMAMWSSSLLCYVAYIHCTSTTATVAALGLQHFLSLAYSPSSILNPGAPSFICEKKCIPVQFACSKQFSC